MVSMKVKLDAERGLTVGGQPLGVLVAGLQKRISALEAVLPRKAGCDNVLNNVTAEQIDGPYAKKAYVDAEFGRLAAELAQKATSDDVAAELSRKADHVHTVIELREKIDQSATKTYVDDELGRVAAELAGKADSVHMVHMMTELHEKVGEFVKKADLDAELRRLGAEITPKSTGGDVAAELSKVEHVHAVVELREKIDQSATKTYVDAELGRVAAALAGKADSVHMVHTVTELHEKVGEFVKKTDLDVELLRLVAEPESPQLRSGPAPPVNLSESARRAYVELESVLKVEHIDFVVSSAKLQKDCPIIARLAAVLLKYPALKICVEGHAGCKCIPAAAIASSTKSAKMCKAIELSKQRAASVVLALQAKGCKNSMVSKGHGCLYRIGMAVKIFPASGQ